MPALRAVLLDSLGTLLELDDPVPRLRAELAARGFELEDERVARAFGAEVAYYVEHHVEGRDQSTLAELRNRCASVLHGELGVPELPLPDAREALLAALAFRAFGDVAPALRELRERGLRCVVVSNWDCSLREVLDGAGVLGLVDEAVSSAEAGAAKPDPRAFEAALKAAGCGPEEAVHVGDSEENDVAGARAAGIRPVLLRRDGGGGGAIASLAELAGVL
ncbi:MAG TPA: HAD-IA family hydrolase [Thermoleophilaceae bacterium]|jgi:putative hydrolase of the HAD superfamily